MTKILLLNVIAIMIWRVNYINSPEKWWMLMLIVMHLIIVFIQANMIDNKLRK